MSADRPRSTRPVSPLSGGFPISPRRFPAEYALANHVEHPLNVNLREDLVIGHVDQWIALEFAPHRLTQTIRDLADAQHPGMIRDPGNHEETARKIAQCDAKLTQYRAALDAGASPATVATWIAETEAEKATYALAARKPTTRLTEAEIKAIVDKFDDIAAVLHDADPDDKAEIFRQLNLRLTYHPGRRLVEAEVKIPQHWQSDSVRGGLEHPFEWYITVTVIYHQYKLTRRRQPSQHFASKERWPRRAV